jgi:predicted ester cyclase
MKTLMRRRTIIRAGAVSAALSVFNTAATPFPLQHPKRQKTTMTRNELVARLVKAGELEVSGGNQTEIDSYFDTEAFRFHGPGGFETDYVGLNDYFRSIRAAFDSRSIRRGIMIVEGNQIACQTWIEGRFVREFTHSPVGAIGPNGVRVIWDLMNIFRFDDKGRIVEEWVRTDYRSFLQQLSAGAK